MTVEPTLSQNSSTIDISVEYNALRGEILQRIGLRQQYVSITLTIAGVFLGIGVTTDTVALVYPPLAALLAIGWAQNDLRIRDIAEYIKKYLESKSSNLGWETYVHEKRVKSKARIWRYIVLSNIGVFLFTQLIAIGLGLLKFTSTPTEWVLIGVDILSLAIIIWTATKATH